MIVKFSSIDPYIASRYGENTCIVFEGTKKQCENYLLDLFNEKDDFYAQNIGEAIKKSNKRGNWDGLFRSTCKGHRAYFRYDSRQWEIMTKKEYKESA